MKKTKKNYIIIALIVMLLTLAVVYASFSEVLNITGTAEADGSFKVYFSNSVFTGRNGESVIDTAGGSKSIAITGIQLEYPGDIRTIVATVKNESTVPVKLTDFTFQNDGGQTFVNTEHINVSISGFTVDSTVIQPGLTANITITVQWPSAANTNVAAGGEEVSFVASFTYTQEV